MTDNFARLLALMGTGGSSGTTDYEALTNKPSIGGVTLIGDLTLADLGIVVDDQLSTTSTNPVQNAVLTALLNAFPYANVTGKPQINGVTLTGNVTLAELGLNALWVGTQAEYATVSSTLAAGTLVIITDDNDIDSTPTENSLNMVTSGGVYAFVTQGLGGKVDKVQGKQLSTEDYTTSEKTKLGGIEVEANKTIVDSALDNSSSNPVQNSVITNALANKVDTVAGKGLSTNDYTDAEKAQVATNTIDIATLRAEHVELTQAEYDVLGNEKYSDDKEYFITDAEPDSPTYIYGFHIDPDESDPADCVTYLADAVGMTPAAMGTTAFSYGSWENVFFMPRPCMLKFDGTVDYYLDPNDYSKKADGTPSDYNNLTYGGNAMMEFPLIWYKFVQGTASGEGYFYCSNQKVDDTYKCWSNLDCDGNIIDHFYMPIYNGCTYNGKMRSISGLTLMPWSTTAYSASSTYAVGDKVNYDSKMYKCITAVETAEAFDPAKWEQFAFNGNTSGTEEITQATANNTTNKVEWYIDQWCDRVLINGLLVLMGKSLDTQGVFGRGIDSGSQSVKEAYVTGSLNDKGLFYGSTANGNTAVKVFGMENWWALVWHRTAGLIGGSNNAFLYKMTASTADGSTASAYNTDGSGYLSVGNKPTTNNYVKKMQFGLFGFLPIEVDSYSTQYFKDYYYSGAGFALVGGNSNNGAHCGAFCANLNGGVTVRYWGVGAAPSCKPCPKG